MCDTSFLISLADRSRPNHPVALEYFRGSLRKGATLFLSTIVISEFQVRQEISDLPLRNFVILPFNYDHAVTAGKLMQKLARDFDDKRAVVKEDVKLIAQAVCESLSHIYTEDAGTLARYTGRLAKDGYCNVSPVLMRDGYDEAHFNGGQGSLL